MPVKIQTVVNTGHIDEWEQEKMDLHEFADQCPRCKGFGKTHADVTGANPTYNCHVCQGEGNVEIVNEGSYVALDGKLRYW